MTGNATPRRCTGSCCRRRCWAARNARTPSASGLEALAGDGPRHVLIHDGARPFVGAVTIDRVLAGLEQAPAVIPAVQITDTIKRVGDGGTVVATVDRAGLWGVQTPQGFHFEAILAAHRAAHGGDPGRPVATDDAQLAEAAGLRVLVVPGEIDNLKITRELDLTRAERLLQPVPAETRVGMGLAVEAFGPGDHVMLCGVAVPHEQGLRRPTADVALNALVDALAGALGGEHAAALLRPAGDRPGEQRVREDHGIGARRRAAVWSTSISPSSASAPRSPRCATLSRRVSPTFWALSRTASASRRRPPRAWASPDAAKAWPPRPRSPSRSRRPSAPGGRRREPTDGLPSCRRDGLSLHITCRRLLTQCDRRMEQSRHPPVGSHRRCRTSRPVRCFPARGEGQNQASGNWNMHTIKNPAIEADRQAAWTLAGFHSHDMTPVHGIALGAILGAVINILILALATYFT